MGTPKRDLDEPVNIDLEPEEALKVLLRAVDGPELPPVGSPPPGDEKN
ncbi:MAG: hypothetical protein WEC34_08320 [Acidimicrobiia bacterium]